MKRIATMPLPVPGGDYLLPGPFFLWALKVSLFVSLGVLRGASNEATSTSWKLLAKRREGSVISRHHLSHVSCSPAQAMLCICASYVQPLKLKSSTMLVCFWEYSWIGRSSISIKIYFWSEEWAVGGSSAVVLSSEAAPSSSSLNGAWSTGCSFARVVCLHGNHPVGSGYKDYRKIERFSALSEKAGVGKGQCWDLTFTFDLRSGLIHRSLTNWI